MSERTAPKRTTTRRATSGRRRRNSLSVDQIVDAAVELSEIEGLAAVSMPRLASKLDCGVMTLYGYVRDKEHLLELMTSRLCHVAVDALPPNSPWDERLGVYSTLLRETMIRSPAVAELHMRYRVWSPEVAHVVETLLGDLTRAGWPLPDAVRAYRAITVYTLGFVAYELRRVGTSPYESYRAWWLHSLADLPIEDFPNLHAAAEYLPQGVLEEQFLWGQAHLLDGLRSEFRARNRRPRTDARQPFTESS